MHSLDTFVAKDLIALSKNKNVPEAVRRHALRLSKARSGDKS